MARVKQPLMSESVVGVVGGLLFRNGTYGNFVSRRSVSPRLTTPAQTEQRARLKAAHTRWNSRSDKVKRAWDAFATYPATGRNAYIGTCLLSSKLGYSPSDNPFSARRVSAISDLTAEIEAPPENQVHLLWQHTGSPTLQLVFYLYQTFEHRASPKPAKLVFWGYSWVSDDEAYLNLPFLAPRNWIRAEVYNPSTGERLQKTLIRLDIAGL